MRLRKFKPNQVTTDMLHKASLGDANFEIEAGEATYTLFAGMISKVERNGKVSIFNEKGFELIEGLSV